MNKDISTTIWQKSMKVCMMSVTVVFPMHVKQFWQVSQNGCLAAKFYDGSLRFRHKCLNFARALHIWSNLIIAGTKVELDRVIVAYQ